MAEGEKKALKACQDGLMCLGIGGLWNWLENGAPIKDLDCIPWMERNVTIVPDSDVWHRPDLMRAVYALGMELEGRGAKITIKIIPQEGERKVGLDDYLVTHDKEGYDSLKCVTLKHRGFDQARRWHKEWMRRNENTESQAETNLSARFPELVDLVFDDKRRVGYLVKTSDGVRVERTWRDDNNGILHPPDRDDIPYGLSDASSVIDHLDDHVGDLYSDIVHLLKDVVVLPSEAHYHLCTVYAFFTYLPEKAYYYPYLWFLGVPERGKSRITATLTRIAWRGLYTETLNEAYLFRFADLFGGTIGLDLFEISERARKRGSHDLLLGRFEDGVKVPRVIAPEKGRFRDTVYYDVHGPTILATNKEIPAKDPLRSRCIKIVMPEARGKYPDPPTREDLESLSIRMLAFRTQHIDRELPDVAKPIPGRLGDLMRPLLRVATLLPDAATNSIMELVKELEAERRESEAETSVGRIVEILFSLQNKLENGRLPVSLVTEKYNEAVPEKYQKTPQGIGRDLSELGIHRKKSDGVMKILWQPHLMEKIFLRYNTVMENSLNSLSAVVEPEKGRETSRENEETSPCEKSKPVGKKGDQGIQGDQMVLFEDENLLEGTI